MTNAVWGLFGVALTLAIFIANVIFRAGHNSARIEELERWRLSMRVDMHEISEKLERQTTEISRLTTVIEERTERRVVTLSPRPAI